MSRRVGRGLASAGCGVLAGGRCCTAVAGPPHRGPARRVRLRARPLQRARQCARRPTSGIRRGALVRRGRRGVGCADRKRRLPRPGFRAALHRPRRRPRGAAARRRTHARCAGLARHRKQHRAGALVGCAAGRDRALPGDAAQPLERRCRLHLPRPRRQWCIAAADTLCRRSEQRAASLVRHARARRGRDRADGDDRSSPNPTRR